MRVIFFTLVAAAAATYCEDSREAFGIDQSDCVSIHQEYMAMLKSGKSLDAISAELREQEGEEQDEFQQEGEQGEQGEQGDEEQGEQSQDMAHSDDSAPDSDMSCAHSCHCGGNEGSCGACNSCMHIRRHNSYCGCRRHNTCRKTVTYGGYVRSHVLIQCYGMIDEGCRRLPTYHSGCYRACGGCSDSCNSASCGCAATCHDANHACGCKTCAQNFRRYLHCVGRRVSRCYRTKIVHTRQVCHSRPTTWGGCSYHWCVPCDQCATSACHNTCSNSCYNTGAPHSLYL